MILLVLILCFSIDSFASESKMDFWKTQKRGTNLFNKIEKAERLKAAKDFGVQFVRIAPNKWLNGRSVAFEGDFLLGRPGQYKSVIKDDLRLLKKVLDDAHGKGLKVVLTMLSLPNARWRQHNNDIEERLIWTDFKYQEDAFKFWRELAVALKDHPAIVGYNIRNEPTPEFLEPKLKDWYTGDYAAWYKRVKGTPADLNLFYKKAVAAIRESDSATPIILDSGHYATPWAFKVLEPLEDQNVIYSFHMYEPYDWNSRHNKGRYEYPGKVAVGESGKEKVILWNKGELEKFFAPVIEWQKKYEISSSRILVGEFGVYRLNKGALDYMRDLIDIFNSQKWHWAFYSFREDNWDGMDYELGTGKAGWKYWQAIEAGKIPDASVYKPNPLSELLKKRLSSGN